MIMLLIKRIAVIAAFTVCGILYVSGDDEEVFMRQGQASADIVTADKTEIKTDTPTTGDTDGKTGAHKTGTPIIGNADGKTGTLTTDNNDLKTDNSITEDTAGITETLTTVNLKININKADEQELTTLNGIGPAKARGIISFRNEHGEFSCIEDLMLVPGIKEGTFGRIKDSITVR